MEYRQLLQSLTPEIYRNLRRAVEIGKWPNGRRLSVEQRQICLQAIIVYDAQHHPEEHRVGYLQRSYHQTCDAAKGKSAATGPVPGIESGPLKWR